jgi:FHA domain
MGEHLLDGLKQLVSGGGALECFVDGRMRRFESPAEFAAALEPLGHLPVHVAKAAVQFDGARAWIELEQTHRLQQCLSELVQWSYASGDPAHGAWRELDAVRFADEHGWRGILRTVDESRHLGDRYLRVALSTYLRYLAERRDLLEQLVRRLGEPAATQIGALRPKAPSLTFDDAQSFTNVKGSADYRRLPINTPVAVTLPHDQAVNLYLAHRRVQLVATDKGWQLRDGEKLRITLRAGRFVVGRASDCDVVLGDAPPDVSRHHLVIECEDADHLRLIDMSAHGTYLPRAAVPTVDTAPAPSAAAGIKH